MPRINSLLPLLLLACAACVPLPPPPAAPPPPIPAAAAPAAVAEAGQVWDVTRVTCGQLLNVDDDDRAAAMMFYYGYLAATHGIRRIDVSQIDANIARVMDQCTKTPGMTVPQAFRTALRGRVRR